MRFPILLLLIAIVLAVPSQCLALDSTALAKSDQLMVLTTNEGLVLEGRILAIADGIVTFQTDGRTVQVPLSEIASVHPVPRPIGMKPGWYPNPNRTRLLFAPTGRMLRAGEGYFFDYYVIFPGVSVGLSDRVTLGGGVSVIPGISIEEQLFYVSPKLGLLASENANLAIGALVIGFPGNDEADGVGGILYGVGTLGSEDANVTVGLGFGFVNEDISGKPILLIGGEKRISENFAFVTENWLIPSEGGQVISYGCRLFGERLSVDLAFLNTIGEDALFPGIPYIDVVYAFGQ